MSNKILDSKNRWRSKTVSFRVSPEEWKQIEVAVQLSGLTKQDYIISRLLRRDIVVQSNPRVYKALRNNLSDVLYELKGNNGTTVNEELLDTIKLISITLNGMRDEIL